MKLDLTGNIRYRKTMFGSLMVEVQYRYLDSLSKFNLNHTDRTLLWGYTTERHSFHIFLQGLIVCKTVYEFQQPSIDIQNNFYSYNELVPNKRLYPEACDAEFCLFLMNKRIALPFTTWQEGKEEKKFYGRTM